MRPYLLALASAAALAGAAQAQPGPPPGGGPSPEARALFRAAREACAADAKSLCPDKTGREMMQCLRANPAKLSASCKDAMSKLPQRPPRPAS
jgi:hypothetical protein